MFEKHLSPTAALVATLSLLPLSLTAQQINRTVLPVPEPQPPTITELDARNVKPPPRFEVKAPKGAPNVVIVLLDDIGFGQSSAFGGPCKMPTAGKAGGRRAALQWFSYHCTLFADSHGVADRPQSPREQCGRYHGTGNRVSRQHRHSPAKRRTTCRDVAVKRLQHRGVRQVSRNAAVGGLGFRTV